MKAVADRWQVDYQRSISYDILNAPDLFNLENEALLSIGRVETGRRFIVVDANVERIYSTRIREYFEHYRVESRIMTFPGGEENKSIDNFLFILKELDTFPIYRRDEPVIAIGGGVVTDAVGFAASSYRRGIPHINVPTTLMGYVDASVGIKTGINFNGNKNRLGSFAPPVRVLLDRSFLRTLPRRHILNGVFEIIKLAVIKDFHLFTLLELYGEECIATQFQDNYGGIILDRAVTGMLEEIQANLYEENLARRVDFGHTFSYGLEMCQEAHLLHGEAVLLDILISVLIAQGRGLISEHDTNRIFALVDRLGVALDLDILDPPLMWQCLEERIRHRNGMQRVPLPGGLGNCVFVNDIRLDEIQSAAAILKERMVVYHDGIYKYR